MSVLSTYSGFLPLCWSGHMAREDGKEEKWPSLIPAAISEHMSLLSFPNHPLNNPDFKSKH